MKPNITLFNVLTLVALNGFSQTTPAVISTSGGSGTGNGISLEWTLGETISGTGSNSSSMLTQGFEQPLIVITEMAAPVNRLVAAGSSSVFPNPVTSVLNVKTWAGVNEKAIISLLDLNGNILVSKQANAANDLQQIDMSKFPASIYLLRITNIYGSVINTYRIVKAK